VHSFNNSISRCSVNGTPSISLATVFQVQNDRLLCGDSIQSRCSGCGAPTSRCDATLLKFNLAQGPRFWLVRRRGSKFFRGDDGQSRKWSLPNVAHDVAQYPAHPSCKCCARGHRWITRQQRAPIKEGSASRCRIITTSTPCIAGLPMRRGHGAQQRAPGKRLFFMRCTQPHQEYNHFAR
jgi:hypothetical protein